MTPTTKIISDYLASHRRITIPAYGTLIIDGDKTLFTEFVKEDDGVLRGLLVEQGLTDLEASAEVERYAAEMIANRGDVVEPIQSVVEPQCPKVENVEDQEVEQTPKRGGVDLLMVLLILVIVAALFVFGYSFVVSWQMGDLVLPEGLDSFMDSLFNGDWGLNLDEIDGTE